MIETQNHFLANSIALINEMDSEIKDMDHLKIASDEEFGNFEGILMILFFLTPLVFILSPILGCLYIILLCIGSGFFTNTYKKQKITYFMDQYKNQKIKMQYIYSSIISDMNIDFGDGNIAPDKIIDIENGIKNYASGVKGLFVSYKKVKSMERCLVSFPDQKVYFLYKDFLTQEGIWLTECIASFSRDLDTWMTRHHSELVQLQSSVDAQARTTDIAEGKAALGITEERISRLSEEIPIRVKS